MQQKKVRKGVTKVVMTFFKLSEKGWRITSGCLYVSLLSNERKYSRLDQVKFVEDSR